MKSKCISFHSAHGWKIEVVRLSRLDPVAVCVKSKKGFGNLQVLEPFALGDR